MGGGSVLFTSSIAALDGSPGQTVYAASKAALIGAVKSMAMELGTQKIRVNAIAPGIIDTPMTRKLDESLLQQRIQLMDIPKIGTSREVANLILYLISDLSTHITGQTIRVDGGIRA